MKVKLSFVDKLKELEKNLTKYRNQIVEINESKQKKAVTTANMLAGLKDDVNET